MSFAVDCAWHVALLALQLRVALRDPRGDRRAAVAEACAAAVGVLHRCVSYDCYHYYYYYYYYYYC